MVIFATAIMGGAITAFGAEHKGKKNGGVLDATTLSCVQTAIDSRDNAIIAGLDVYYPTAKTALQTRQAGLKAAWAQTDQKTRKEAVKTVWEMYKDSVKSARTVMKGAQKTAWTKFEADRKTCNPKAAGDDKGTFGIDSQI